MSERVDSRVVEDIISTLNSIQFFDQAHDVDLSAAAKTLKALLVERDALEAELERFKEERGYVVGFNDGWQALEAENQRLREALEWVSQNGGFAHPGNIVSVAKTALAEQEKNDDQ